MEIRLDYATFNFDKNCIDVDQISHALAGDQDVMLRQKGKSGSFLVSPFGLSYLNDSGWSPRPHRLQVSGVGCEKFAYTLPNLVTACNENGGECSFSRLDFAFDVIIKKDQWKSFLAKAFESSLYSERRLKKYALTGDGMAMTVYIGSRRSDYYFRIYNKSLESKEYVYTENGQVIDISDNEFVIRYEIEMKRHVHHIDNKCTVFDPSRYFFDYYNENNDLCEVIRNLWLDFGEDVLLPDGFAECELTLYSKNKNFASITPSVAIEVTQDRITNDSKQFSDTLFYIVSHFGKYIPFLVDRADLYEACQYLCKQFCGFVPIPDAGNLLYGKIQDINEDFDVDEVFEPIQLEIDHC